MFTYFVYFLENNNDLFAKAPFGSEQPNNTINALTQGEQKSKQNVNKIFKFVYIFSEIFGGASGVTALQNNQNNGGNVSHFGAMNTGAAFNPWATPPSANSAFAATPTAKPNPTNPFL